MSSIGGPIAANAAGAPEAQRRVNDAKEKRRNDETQRRRRFEDALELHISQVESPEAVQAAKEHAREDAESERNARPEPTFHQRPTHASGMQTYGPPALHQMFAPISGAVHSDAGGDEQRTNDRPSIDVTG